MNAWPFTDVNIDLEIKECVMITCISLCVTHICGIVTHVHLPGSPKPTAVVQYSRVARTGSSISFPYESVL